VAGTYSQHVVVCGLGHVGSRVIENLLRANSDVIGVEQNMLTSLANRVEGWGVTVIEGDIRDPEVLKRAGIAKARTVVICTNNDLANLEAAIRCRELNPGVRLVVRLFDPELARRMKAALEIDEAFSASALAAPIFAGAALDVDVNRTFAVGGDIFSVGRVTINPNSRLAGATVGVVENEFDCSVIIHERNGTRDMHPAESLRLQAGDLLVILADLPTLNRVAAWNQGRRR
jgi:Trk K+ transport system NAD-binding subunit